MIYSQLIASIFLVLFTVVASIDGMYFHLYKYRLFEKKDSIREHNLHTLNAFFFPFTVLLLFVLNASGFLLWISIILTLITLILEFMDVFEEKKSRKHLGGLTSLEYSMHFGMSGIRSAYTVLVLAQKPFLAWSLWSPWIIRDVHYPFSLRIIGMSVAILGVPVFLLHYYLGSYFEKS